MKFLYMFIRFLLWLPVKLLLPTKIIGKENLPKNTPVITISNHTTWKDIFVVAINLPGFRRALAKKEIGKFAPVRVLARGAGIILVDREKADLSAIRTCIASVKKGQSLIVFPEGTRNRTAQKILPLKAGAAMIAVKCDVPVVPVLIHKKPRFFRKNYIYIAEPFSFDEMKDGVMNGEKLQKCADKMYDKMLAAKETVDGYATDKKLKGDNNA